MLAATEFYSGNPVAFAVLARALAIPWLAVFDGDTAGKGYVMQISKRDFESVEIALRCRTLPAGDLEKQLLTDGFEPELRSILQKLGYADAPPICADELIKRLDREKTRYAAALAAMIADNPSIAIRMPQAFRDAIGALRGLT